MTTPDMKPLLSIAEEAYADHRDLELAAMKERLDLPEGLDHLKAWRDECYKRDQTSTVIDSDIVALIDWLAILQSQIQARDEAVKGPMRRLFEMWQKKCMGFDPGPTEYQFAVEDEVRDALKALSTETKL